MHTELPAGRGRCITGVSDRARPANEVGSGAAIAHLSDSQHDSTTVAVTGWRSDMDIGGVVPDGCGLRRPVPARDDISARGDP